MKNSKNRVLLGVIAILVITFAVITSRGIQGTTAQGKEKQEIVIGVSAPLTGDLAFLGETYQNGINLALAEIGATDIPGVYTNNTLKYSYKVVFQDDAFIPARGVTTARKLIETDKASIVFSFGSPVGNAIGPIAEEYKIPHLNSIASDPNVAKGDWNFVHWTPPYKETDLFVKELKKRNISRIILLEQKQPGVTAVTNSLRKDIVGSGIEIVASDSFDGATKDFRSIVTKIKPAKADLIVLEATSPSLEVLARQIREQGISLPWTSIETFEFTDDIKLFEGSWYVNAADHSEKFSNAYFAKYNTSPKLGAGNGYDSVKMIVEVAERYGTSPADIRRGLTELKDWNGAMGNNLYIDTDGIVVSQAVVRTIQNGKPMTIK